MTGVVVSAFAQNATDSTSAVTHDATLTADIYPGQEDGDLYHGLTRNSPLTGWFLRMDWK